MALSLFWIPCLQILVIVLPVKTEATVSAMETPTPVNAPLVAVPPIRLDPTANWVILFLQNLRQWSDTSKLFGSNMYRRNVSIFRKLLCRQREHLPESPSRLCKVHLLQHEYCYQPQLWFWHCVRLGVRSMSLPLSSCLRPVVNEAGKYQEF